MCGIYGEIVLQSEAKLSREGNCAVDCMTHRGPDERGSWSDASRIFLGMRRLSILDAAGGAQPFFSHDKTYVLVFNGEIYNYQEIKKYLKQLGYILRTSSDTEVVLYAMKAWGIDALKRFNGMFAMAYWDAVASRLILARDRVGEKPLYYTVNNGCLRFASEIKSILADSFITRTINIRGLKNYLGFGHAAAPDTIYTGIKKLLPGHALIVEGDRVRDVAYWNLGFDLTIDRRKSSTMKEDGERILNLLESSVRLRMNANVSVGAFLSGGIDSSAVVALMSKNSNSRVKTFSLGFNQGKRYNELDQARFAATFFGTEHHEILVSDEDCIQALDRLAYHFDEPFGDAAALPAYLLSHFARSFVKVVLTGDGGDELFGGYRRYATEQLSSSVQWLPKPLLQLVSSSVSNRLTRFRRIQRACLTLPIIEAGKRYASWLSVFSTDLQFEILHSHWHDDKNYDCNETLTKYYYPLPNSMADDPLNRLMALDFKTWLPDGYLEKIDKATMAASLEARTPMLDPILIDYAFQIPSDRKIRGLSLKRVLKHALCSLVPKAILNRPKRGFSVPTDPWFRGGLNTFLKEILLDQRTTNRGIFVREKVESLIRSHEERRGIHDTQLWTLLNFELWARIYLDRGRL